MAIDCTKVASSNHYAYNSSGFTVGAFGTYDPTCDYWVVIQMRDGTAPPTEVNDQGSGTWTQQHYYATSEYNFKTFAFRLTSGTPSGNVSVAFGGGGADVPHAVLLKVAPTETFTLSFDGFIPGTDDATEYTSAATNPHTLDTSGAPGGTAVVTVSANGAASTPATGWTELHDFHDANGSGMAIQFSATNADGASVYTFVENAVGHVFGIKFTEAAGGEPTAVLTGTATEGIDESDIVAGGKTIIATLDGATLKPASGTGTPTNTGNTFPGTGENVDRSGSNSWSNPGNIVSDNGSDATINASGSDYLVARNFGFNIPAGAAINGITVRVEASEHSTGDETFSAQLQNDGATLVGSAKTVSLSGTGKTVYTYGGTADVWGATLTPEIINHANFGARFWFTTSHDVRVDYVTIAVQYTPATTPFADARQAAIDGIDGDLSTGTSWDAVRSGIAVSALVRTSDTVMTLTLPALGSYDISEIETLEWTIPSAILVSGGPIVATPTIEIGAGAEPAAIGTVIPALMRMMLAP